MWQMWMTFVFGVIARVIAIGQLGQVQSSAPETRSS